MSRKARRGGPKRSYRVWIIPALVLVTAVTGYYIFSQSGTAGGASPLDNTQVPQSVLSQLSGVSFSTLNQVGSSAANINPPSAISNPGNPLTLNGKPEVLYMGAEYCPYCAAERWAMIVALDKFGNFTGIEYMQSTGTDVYPNTPTFTFVGATYASNYVSFGTVEQEDRNGAPLQTASTDQSTLLTTYDTGGTIPFVDFGNKYLITSSQYVPTALRVGDTATGAAYNWTQIAPQLNNASSIFAQNIDVSANQIIAAVCKIDGGAPASVCTQTFASVVSYIRNPASGNSQLLVSDDVLRAQAPSAARLAPTRLSYWV